jgi:hypothetical protein
MIPSDERNRNDLPNLQEDACYCGGSCDTKRRGERRSR